MRRFIHTIYAILAGYALLWSGCTNNEPDVVTGEDDGDEVTLEFTYYIEQPSYSVETRSVYVSDDAFNRVNNIDVLIYEATGTALDQQKLKYHRGTFDQEINQTIGKGSFKVTMPKSKNGEKYVFDILFNARNYITSCLYSQTSNNFGFFNLDNTRDVVHEKFWIYASGGVLVGGTTPSCPMWACVNVPMEIGNNMGVLTMSKPIRSIATFSVGLNFDSDLTGQGMSNFRMTAFQTMGIPTSMRIIPDLNYLDASGEKVTAPTLPSSTTYTNTSAASLFGAGMITNGAWVRNSTYMVFESEPANTPNYGFALGGIFTDPETGTTSTRYYKINVPDPYDPNSQLRILRNHHYMINILGEITNSTTFYTSAVSAIRGNVYAELDVLIISPDDPDLNYVVYNNIYYLGVSEQEINFNAAGETKELVLKTSYGKGWYALISSSSIGLTCSSHATTEIGWNSANTQFEFNPSTTSIGKETVTLEITMPQNTTGSPRSETITFTLNGGSTNPLTLIVDISQD